MHVAKTGRCDCVKESPHSFGCFRDVDGFRVRDALGVAMICQNPRFSDAAQFDRKHASFPCRRVSMVDFPHAPVAADVQKSRKTRREDYRE